MHRIKTALQVDVLLPVIFLSRFQLSAALAGWGLWIWIFDSFNTSPTFNAMAKLASEDVWGFCFVATGIISWFVMFYQRFQPHSIRRHRVELTMVALVTAGWLFVAIILAYANFNSTATFTYFVITFASLLNFIELTGVVEVRRYLKNG